MRKHGILFGYTPGTNKLAVAELTISYIIAGLRWVMPLNIAMRDGERPRMRLGKGLTGRTVGIHGCGNVGKEVVRLLKPFNCEILVHDIADYPDFYRENGVKAVSFDEMLERSEVLTLHVPKTAATIGLYDETVLARLRPDCVLVNTCRGGIVDEDVLYERLSTNKLAARVLRRVRNRTGVNDKLINLPKHALVSAHRPPTKPASRWASPPSKASACTNSCAKAKRFDTGRVDHERGDDQRHADQFGDPGFSWRLGPREQHAHDGVSAARRRRCRSPRGVR